MQKTAYHEIMLQRLLAYCKGQLRVKGWLHHIYSSMTYNQNNVFYDVWLLKEPFLISLKIAVST